MSEDFITQVALANVAKNALDEANIAQVKAQNEATMAALYKDDLRKVYAALSERTLAYDTLLTEYQKLMNIAEILQSQSKQDEEIITKQLKNIQETNDDFSALLENYKRLSADYKKLSADHEKQSAELLDCIAFLGRNGLTMNDIPKLHRS